MPSPSRLHRECQDAPEQTGATAAKSSQDAPEQKGSTAAKSSQDGPEQKGMGQSNETLVATGQKGPHSAHCIPESPFRASLRDNIPTSAGPFYAAPNVGDRSTGYYPWLFDTPAAALQANYVSFAFPPMFNP